MKYHIKLRGVKKRMLKKHAKHATAEWDKNPPPFIFCASDAQRIEGGCDWGPHGIYPPGVIEERIDARGFKYCVFNENVARELGFI